MHHPIHRAIVTFSDNTTGEIRVKIPSVLGINSEVSISYIGRNAPWVVPSVGEQIVVTSDDANMTNVFWMQTEKATGTTGAIGPTGPTGPAGATGPAGVASGITVSGSAPANNTIGSNGDIWIVV